MRAMRCQPSMPLLKHPGCNPHIRFVNANSIHNEKSILSFLQMHVSLYVHFPEEN